MTTARRTPIDAATTQTTPVGTRTRGVPDAAALVAVAVAALAGMAGIRAARAYRAESGDWATARSVVPRPADATRLRLTDVGFRTPDGELVRGWYIPSMSGAAVILCSGSGSNRSTMLPQARGLAARGLGVLLFDWPGQGESAGTIRKGQAEREALAAAIDFVASRPDVVPGRIGAVGFSLGAYILAQVAGRDPRVRATVLEGAYGDSEEQTRAQFVAGGPIAQWGAVLADRVAGFDPGTPPPTEAVREIAPRSLLFVAGDRDVTVPVALSRHLHDAARPPKEFWVVRGAGHGEYVDRDPTFLPRLAEYLVRQLQ